MKVSESPERCTRRYAGRKEGLAETNHSTFHSKWLSKGPRGARNERWISGLNPLLRTPRRAGNAPRSCNCGAFGPPTDWQQAGNWYDEPAHQSQRKAALCPGEGGTPSPVPPPARGSCSRAAGQGRARGTGDTWHPSGCPPVALAPAPSPCSACAKPPALQSPLCSSPNDPLSAELGRAQTGLTSL